MQSPTITPHGGIAFGFTKMSIALFLELHGCQNESFRFFRCHTSAIVVFPLSPANTNVLAVFVAVVIVIHVHSGNNLQPIRRIRTEEMVPGNVR